MPNKSKFPAFTAASEAHDQVQQLIGEIRILESREKALVMDATLPPLEAARDFVQRENSIKTDLRERRLAISTTGTDTFALWQAAAGEMRTEGGKIDAEIRSLIERAQKSAARMLTPIAVNLQAAADQTILVTDGQAFLREFSATFFAAFNANRENAASNVTALHEAIENAPPRIKAIEAGLSTYELAAADLAKRFPAPVEVEA